MEDRHWISALYGFVCTIISITAIYNGISPFFVGATLVIGVAHMFNATWRV